MTLQIQFATLGMMCIGGLSLGTMFDLYRVLAGQLRIPMWSKAVLDLFYWFIGTLLVFWLLYRTNLGEIRPFIFLGLGIGLCLYFLLFSGTVIRIIRWLIRLVVSVYRFGQRVVQVLVVKPVIGLYKLVVLVLGFLLAVAMFLYKIMIQLIQPVWKFIQWLIRSSLLRIPIPKRLMSAAKRIASWFRR